MLVLFLIIICIALTVATVVLSIKFFSLQSEHNSSVDELEECKNKARTYYQVGVKLKAICQSLQKYKPISDIDEAIELRKKKKIELEGQIIETKKTAQGILLGAENESTKLLNDAKAKSNGIVEHANLRASTIISDGRVKAEEIAGEAYRALENKTQLDKAIRAMKNVINGYGDEYLVPTASLGLSS